MNARISLAFTNNKLAFDEFFGFFANIGKFDFQILYGRKWFTNSSKNFRAQLSPLIAEISLPPKPDDEVFKIGKEKYFGYWRRSTCKARNCNWTFYLSAPTNICINLNLNSQLLSAICVWSIALEEFWGIQKVCTISCWISTRRQREKWSWLKITTHTVFLNENSSRLTRRKISLKGLVKDRNKFYVYIH